MTYERLIKWIHPTSMPDFIKDIIKEPVLKRQLLRSHKRYVDKMKRQMKNVPNSIECKVKASPYIIGIRLLRGAVPGLSIREAIWFHRYFTKGILPWFYE